MQSRIELRDLNDFSIGALRGGLGCNPLHASIIISIPECALCFRRRQAPSQRHIYALSSVGYHSRPAVRIVLSKRSQSSTCTVKHTMHMPLQAALADTGAGGGGTAERGLERSASSLSKRSNSGAVRIGSNAAAASAASSPGTTAAQQVSNGLGLGLRSGSGFGVGLGLGTGMRPRLSLVLGSGLGLGLGPGLRFRVEMFTRFLCYGLSSQMS